MQQEGLDLPMEVIRSVILRNPDVLLLSGASPAVTATSKTAKPVTATAVTASTTATAKKRKLRSAGASDVSELNISELSFTELKSSRLARTVSVPIGPLVTVGILVHYGKLKQSVAVKLIIQMPDILTMPQGRVPIYHVHSIHYMLFSLCIYVCVYSAEVYCMHIPKLHLPMQSTISNDRIFVLYAAVYMRTPATHKHNTAVYIHAQYSCIAVQVHVGILCTHFNTHSVIAVYVTFTQYNLASMLL
jgi:hypothetical protein